MARTSKTRPRKAYMFFLRFYGAPKESIDACLDELRALGYDIVEHGRGPAKLSCNWFMPPQMEAVQVNVTFSNTTPQAFMADEQARQVYMKYAAPKQKGKLVVRKPGDSAFAV